MALQYIFAQPDYIEGIDKDNPITIYPITLKDHDKFQECSKLLYISKKHFEENSYPLLALVFMSYQQFDMSQEELIENLCLLFSMVTNRVVNFFQSENSDGFLLDDDNIISVQNYEDVRAIIMRQNLMFEQKIYKTELMNKWAAKALLSKQKNASNISMEDVISTVSVGCSKHYYDLQNYTMYQIYSDFYRLRKTINYDSSIQFKCAGSDLTLEDYAESLDLFHNPYDDLFVSSDKLTGLNKAIKK